MFLFETGYYALFALEVPIYTALSFTNWQYLLISIYCDSVCFHKIYEPFRTKRDHVPFWVKIFYFTFRYSYLCRILWRRQFSRILLLKRWILMLFVLILSVTSLALSVRSDQPTWSVVLRNNEVGLFRIIRDQRGVVACSSKLITMNLRGLFETFLQSIRLKCTASNR